MDDSPKNFKKYGEIFEFLDIHGVHYTKMCKNWRNDPIIVIERKGDVIVTAGSHGDEYGAVEAALKLSTEHILFTFIPARDPSGINSFIDNLEFLVDSGKEVRDEEGIIQLIKNNSDWFFEDKDLGVFIGVFWDISVCYAKIRDEWAGEDDINERLQQILDKNEKVREKLEGMRVLIPSSLPKSEGVGMFDRTFTSFVYRGKVLNYNRIFHIQEESMPEEVLCIKRYIDEKKPKIVLDLHEGYGDKFYQFVPIPDDPMKLDLEVNLVKTLFDGVIKNGLEVLKVKEAKEIMKEERKFFFNNPDDYTVITIFDEEGKSLSTYALAKLDSISSTLETGMRASLKKRIDMHKSAVIHLYENINGLIRDAF